jgi:type IV pilus assembly protein PilY1
MKARWLSPVALIAVLAVPQAASAQAIINNGTVALGINPWGNLNYNDIGVTHMVTNHESTFDGCPCEGWGAGISGGFGSGVNAFANQASGIAGFSSVSWSATASTFTSNTVIGGILGVEHYFTPSPSSNLYQVRVTMKNLSGSTIGAGPAGLRYTRVMDWDIEPTQFNEFVTIQGNGAANLLHSDDNGFQSGAVFDPRFAGCAGVFNTDVVDSGSCDHGALFDFGFGPLAAGQSLSFNIYYGAALTEGAMMSALGTVGAEVYSLGQAATCHPGDPNCETFAFAFGGVGGTAVAPEPGTLALMATGLVGLGGYVRRRRRA